MDFSGVIRDLHLLRSTLPCQVEYEPHLAAPESYEAKYEHGKNRIVLNGFALARSGDPERKKEFLIYHELFHALCGQNKTVLEDFASLEKTEEELADFFAAVMLTQKHIMDGIQ